VRDDSSAAGGGRSPDPPGRGEINSEVLKTVVGAYYGAKLEAPKAARTNAQNAYTIAAAVAAAVVAAGAFVDLSSRPTSVQILGAAALAVWLITAALFMWAVAAPSEDASGLAGTNEATEFVKEAMRRAKNETAAINDRQFFARISAGAASVLTVAALALGLFLPPASTTKDVTVRLDPAEQASLTELCGKSVPTVVSGTTDTKDDGDGTIEFDPEENACKMTGTTSLQEKRTLFILDP
jgi:hypothetical protein